MKRFILREPPTPAGIIRLYREDYRYLVRARRLVPGALFPALLPGGRETQVKVLSTVDGILIGECQGFAPAAPSPPSPQASPPIYLFQGLPKGSKMDLIVRQAAEGGVAGVIPFESAYSVTKVKGLPPDRLARWERIIREARQQSGSPTPTAIAPPRSLEKALAYWAELQAQYPRAAGILMHQEPLCAEAGGEPQLVAAPPLLAQGGFHEYLVGDPDAAALFVGPEGGFSPEEASMCVAAGLRPLVIGDTILRTETAALYGTAAVRIILLESQSWMLRQQK